ncbi:cobalamin biosynthesis protein [Hahella sp. CCB-MM4]|uniref:adenosylcobinamide-phosphate synthase CbiB n=1 Tax=Hahella sp. (strain CCB-MM4) TaxID=1926491 RepID=UPI000B9A4C29|nr:adenosylcobinamide-phosphate synthase CbiB [Hahella sp. CCB-MM4]OZG72710.1 cobalamin biosynthesis protein [Hahella sp. CCB-MM4]
MMSPLSFFIGLGLDRLLGEPRKYHPLVGFGTLAGWIENQARRLFEGYLAGVLALVGAVMPLTLAAWWLDSALEEFHWIHALFAGGILYLAIGWQSLLQHAEAIARPLALGDLETARQAVSMIVSRDTRDLDEAGIATAATESVLENGADAIFSALFWFLVAGVPGVVLYRLSNTLDAMWGYKNERYLVFGWAAARFDDLLNFIPARLTALTYALAGETSVAMACWKQQAPTWKSPNAGPVMAAGAGALNVSLGGGAQYHGRWQERPPLGPLPGVGMQASSASIHNACRLLNKSLVIWTVAVLIVAGVA